MDKNQITPRDTDIAESPKKSIWKNLFWAIFTYLFFLGLSYLIAQFIEIPLEISFLLYFLFGFIGVLIKIDPKYLKRLKNVPLLRRHFSIMYKVNQKISKTVEESTLKNALKFAFGMIYLIVYYTWLNLLFMSLKYLVSLVIVDINNPFQFIEAFFCLLGAGIVAYLKWLNALYRHHHNSIQVLRSTEKHRRVRFIGSQFSLGIALYTLLQSYLIWMGGLTAYLFTNLNFVIYIPLFLTLAGVFLGFIALILFLLYIIEFSQNRPKRAHNEGSE